MVADRQPGVLHSPGDDTPNWFTAGQQDAQGDDSASTPCVAGLPHLLRCSAVSLGVVIYVSFKAVKGSGES